MFNDPSHLKQPFVSVNTSLPFTAHAWNDYQVSSGLTVITGMVGDSSCHEYSPYQECHELPVTGAQIFRQQDFIELHLGAAKYTSGRRKNACSEVL